MSWHQEGQIHISWGPEGEKLPPDEREKYAAELMADAKTRREQHDKADRALEGPPFVAVPIEQLESIYERMLRLVSMGQTHVGEFHTMPESLRALRRAVFEQADFGAVFAGQWLPPLRRQSIHDEFQAEQKAANANGELTIPKGGYDGGKDGR